MVVANCGGSDAEASPVFTFRTACGQMTVPFFDNFDNYTNGAWPPCWHRLRAYGTDPSVNAQYHHSGSQSMFQLASNDTTLFCTPTAVPLDGDNIYVRYWAFLNWSSYYTETKWIKAGVMTDTSDMSTFIALDSVFYHNFNNVFEEREFNTATLDHDSVYWVAWMFYSTNVGYDSYNRGAVDDIYISAIPNCLRVSSVTVVNTDSNSITVNWVDAANSGATYTVMVGDSVAATGVTDSSYTVTDLNANTQYTISVAVECGSENSEAVSVSARTTCGGYPIPYSYGFEDATDMACWNEVVGSSYGGRTNSDASTGSYSYRFYYGTQSSLTSPLLTGTDNGLKFQFKYKRYSTYYSEGFKVGYSTTGIDDTMFVWGPEITDASDVYQTYEAIYPAGTKYVSVKYTTTDNYGIYLDDFNFMLPPDCMPVSLLTVDTITSDGATIHWTAPDGQSNFIVRLNDSIFYTISDTFYFFNGLDARTLYNVAVATDCYGDTSDWVTISFATGCANGECEIIVTSTSGYTYGTYYDATLHVVQNGVELASVIGATDTVSVCTGIPVSIIYEEPEYDYSYYPPTATIVDGGDDVVFNGNTSSNSTGDTLVTMANACPSCLKPANLIATLIDSNNITVSWNAVDTVLDYEISINGGAWTNATSPYMASGLNPNTAYTFSVRAICAIGDTSNGRNLTVKTSCGQMVLPLVEGFENDPQGTVPSCWTVVRTGYGNYPGISGSEHTGNNGMTMGADFNDSTTIASSLVPLPGDSIYVSFWASVNSGNTLQAGVMTDLAFDTTFIPLLTVPSNGSTYTLYEFNTSSLGTGFSYTNFYVAFRLVTGGSNHYADIDDINIRLNEGCMYPANLTVVNVSSSGADLEWHNNGTLTDFVVEYRTGSGAWDSAGATTDTTFNIIGLNAAQNYEARVGLVCGTDTLWRTVTFQTSCAILPLPYFENFTGYVNDGPLPPCWTYTSPGVRYYDGGAMWGQYTGNGSAIAVVPELSGNITKLQISFDAKLWKSGNNYDQVLIGVADASGTLLQWLDTLSHPQQSQANFINFTVYFTDYNIPTGAARVAFGRTHDGIGDHWALIDNINIVALPDCYPVANLTPHNLSDPEATSFTWVSQGYASQWQVYVDTVTVGIDSVENMPDSLFTTVTDTNYLIPIGDITGGGIYNIFVRSDCGFEYSNWVKYEFGAGTVIMNQSTVADTVTGCGFVVYDNGGPIAGYESNSSSALVIRTENAGSQLEIFGGKFGFGPSAATLTVYDGEGTSGTVLFTYNTVNGRDTLLDTILATSTTGALTLTFSAGQYNHTGYELYVRCTAGATCPKPTELQGTMTSATTADVTWVGSAMSYNFYYRLSGTTAWTMQTTATNSISLTGLITDTVYDMYVVAICSATDSSTPSVTRQLNTYYEVVIDPCDPVSDVVVSNITNNTAEVSWTSTGNEWEIELTNVSGTTTLTANTNPFTLVNLLPNMQYSVRVRTICNGTNVDPYSDWTTAVTFTTLMNAPTMYNVTVTSNNDAWGTVSGGGQYADGSSVVISATAAEGYYFDQWNDGDTNATRTIVVTGDVTYTANFAEDGTVNTYYTITVLSNNNAWGTVSGGGQYVDGSVVTLTATAAEGYHLEQWSTGETTNTISVTVTADATYTATFAANNDGIDGVEGNVMSLFPNPASTVVTISVEMEGNVTLSIVDMNGRTVYTKQGSDHSFSVDVSAMAKGAYFVRIVGEQSTAVSKLIVK